MGGIIETLKEKAKVVAYLIFTYIHIYYKNITYYCVLIQSKYYVYHSK
jgi:hypothetical protein